MVGNNGGGHAEGVHRSIEKAATNMELNVRFSIVLYPLPWQCSI